MAKVTEFTGKEGIVSVGGSEIAVADFSVVISRGAATQARSGKYSDRKRAGKVDVTGTMTSLDIDGALVEELLGGTPSDSSSEALHASADLSGGGDEEVVDVGTDPTNPSVVKITITRGDADGTASWITIQGTDNNDDDLAETVSVVALTAAVSPLTLYTNSVFKTVDHFVAGAGMNVGSANFTEVALDAITGTRTTLIGAGGTFTLFGRAIDSSNNKYEINIANCFFTESTFAFSDADTFIDGPLSFTMEDPDTDLQCIRTS
jgi:hypothetical protein